MSKGSELAPNPPAGFEAAGVADAHPPKSSSAVTDACRTGLGADELELEIGAPHPPEISLGVIREGTLPSSTFGATGFAGSGAPHALVSAPPHGSNILALDCATIVGLTGCVAGAGLGAVMVGEDRLNAESKAGGLCIGGDGILGAVVGLFIGADEKLLKPSSPNKSAGIGAVEGFGGGGDDD